MKETTTGNKVALITGASWRLGAAIAHLLHEHHYNIIIHYRHSDATKIQKQLLQKRPHSVQLLRGDLTQTEQLPEMIRQAHNCWGRLDVLINNASLFQSNKLGETTEKFWDELMNTNLKAPFFLAQAAMPTLSEHKGCIINMADIHGERPLEGYGVYSISKAALISLTESLAKELAPHVRVNAIAPGAILWPNDQVHEETKNEILQKTALKCMGSPEDIAEGVLFLVDKANYTTGQVLHVDGGRFLNQ